MNDDIISIVLGLAGLSILIAEIGWLCGLGVFLMIWGNNHMIKRW